MEPPAMSVAAASAAAAAAAAAQEPVSNETADGCGGRQMALTPECRPGVALLNYQTKGITMIDIT